MDPPPPSPLSPSAHRRHDHAAAHGPPQLLPITHSPSQHSPHPSPPPHASPPPRTSSAGSVLHNPPGGAPVLQPHHHQHHHQSHTDLGAQQQQPPQLSAAQQAAAERALNDHLEMLHAQAAAALQHQQQQADQYPSMAHSPGPLATRMASPPAAAASSSAAPLRSPPPAQSAPVTADQELLRYQREQQIRAEEEQLARYRNEYLAHQQQQRQQRLQADVARMRAQLQVELQNPAATKKLERKLARLLTQAAAFAANSAAAAAAGGFSAASALANSAAAAAGAFPSAAAAAVAAPVARQQRDEADPDATSFQTDTASLVVFQQYRCHSLSFGAPHPCDVTEAGTLSGVRLPPATYPLQASLPPHIIANGLLSALQLEGALYAAQRHQQILHDGSRAGFFLADGAGVGKGRQIAAMLVDSLHRGNSAKHCWFSVSTDLYLESKRDLLALGCNARVINGLQSIDAATKNQNWSLKDLTSAAHKNLREGVMYCTYSSLVSGMSGQRGKRKQSRLEQLVMWCGGSSFNGLLIFDECHRAKNYKEGQEENSSLTGQAVVKLQQMLPHARVVYASATGVTDIANMSYFVRLGLWGAGCSFDSFAAFEKAVSKRGIGAFELLAMELKGIGCYVSRGLSYASCEYIYVNADLDEAQEAIYDAVVKFWLELKDAFGQAMSMCDCENTLWRVYWGLQLRFFGQLCSSAKVHTIVEETQKALSEGYAVVIGLQTTGESSMAHQFARELEGEPAAKRARGEGSAAAASSSSSSNRKKAELPSLFKEMLLRFIDSHFPVHKHVPKPKAARKPRRGALAQQRPVDLGPAVVWGGAGAHAAVPMHIDDESAPSTPNSVMDMTDDREHNDSIVPPAAVAAASAAAAAAGPPVPIPAAVELREQMKRKAAALLLPTSPLDELIDLLGGKDVVAEMTGRGARYIRTRSGRIELENRDAKGAGKDDSTMDINLIEKNSFMNGDKLIAIISDAASTGISLHADRAVKNQRKRMHITMELPWSADSAIQQLGRTHRSNEVCGVLYALVTSNLGGERRFSSACASRLQSLGALTKGDRRAATGSNFAQFDIDTKYGRIALRSMVDCVWKGTTALEREALAQLQAAGQQVLPEGDEIAAHAERDEELKRDPPPADQLTTHAALIPHPQPWSVHNAPMFRECLLAMGFSEHDPPAKLQVKNFLNRILCLPVRKQNLLFEYFMQVLNFTVLSAKKEGTYSEAVTDISAEHITVRSEQTLAEMLRELKLEAAGHKGNGAKAGAHRGPAHAPTASSSSAAAAAAASSSSHANGNGAAAGSSLAADDGSRTRVYELALDRGISYEAACEMLQNVAPEQESAFTSFYLGTHPVTNAVLPLLAIKRPNSMFQFQICRPNSGRATMEMSKDALLRMYHRVSAKDIRAAWSDLYELTLNHCTHGPKCKLGHVLSYLSELNTLADRYASQLTLQERQLRVVRVTTDNGDRLVGLLVPRIVLNIWTEQLATGEHAIAAGLGVPHHEEPPKFVDPALISQYSCKPTAAAVPSFFGGDRSALLSSNAPSIDADVVPALPHQSSHLSSPQHRGHALPSLAPGFGSGGGGGAAAAAAPSPASTPHRDRSEPVTVSAKKQTSLASFFAAKPPQNKAPQSAAAASASSSVKQERAGADSVSSSQSSAASAAPFHATSSFSSAQPGGAWRPAAAPKKVQSKISAHVISLISSDSEDSRPGTPVRRPPPPSRAATAPHSAGRVDKPPAASASPARAASHHHAPAAAAAAVASPAAVARFTGKRARGGAKSRGAIDLDVGDFLSDADADADEDDETGGEEEDDDDEWAPGMDEPASAAAAASAASRSSSRRPPPVPTHVPAAATLHLHHHHHAGHHAGHHHHHAAAAAAAPSAPAASPEPIDSLDDDEMPGLEF